MDNELIKLDLMKAQKFLREKTGAEQSIATSGYNPKVWITPDSTVDFSEDHEFYGCSPFFYPPFPVSWPFDTMSYIVEWPDGHTNRHVAMKTKDDDWVEIVNID